MRSPGPEARSTVDHVRARRVTIVFWVLALVFGFLQAWAARFIIQGDCVSYLDMGDAIVRGDWKMVVNGYFFPLWAVFLGVAMFVVKPSPVWEYFVVHLVNLVIFLLCAACFEFLLRELLRDHRSGISQRFPVAVWPKWVWRTLGYSVFLWSSLALIGVSKTTPDMLLAAFLYLATGLLVRIHSGRAGLRAYIALGAVLGFAYLTKSVMFPLAFVFLAVAAFATPDCRLSFRRFVGALAAFLVIAGPYVLVLSISRNRFDFGDSGRLAYDWIVNGTPSRHWQGEPAGTGLPLHPTRQLLHDPPVYEFRGPLGETYPLWYDVSYWYEGLRVHFHPVRQAAALARNAKEILGILLGLHGTIFVGLALLVAVRGGGWSLVRDLSGYWFLFLPAAAGLGLYALVDVLPRYVAVFVVLLVLAGLFATRPADTLEARRLGKALAFVFSAMLLVSLAGRDAFPKRNLPVREFFRGSPTQEHPYWQVADGLRRMGLSPRDRVAVLNYGNFDHVFWARLARVQIGAEIYYGAGHSAVTDDFWSLAPAGRTRVVNAFKKTGARVIVSDRQPPRDEGAGWERIGDTPYHAYWLER